MDVSPRTVRRKLMDDEFKPRCSNGEEVYTRSRNVIIFTENQLLIINFVYYRLNP